MVYVIILLSAIITGGAIASSSGGGGSGKSNPGVVLNSNSSWNETTNQNLINKYRTSEYKEQWGLESIRASEAYALLEQNQKSIAGDAVKIGIADSGVRSDLLEIKNNFTVDGSSPGGDSDGHGTNVASIAAGVKNNSVTHGVAFNAKILSVNIFDDKKVGYGITSSANAGAKVVNMSFAFADVNNNEIFAEIGDLNYQNYKSVLQTEFNSAKDKDVFVAIAVGNSGNSQHVTIPALLVQDKMANGNMIAVGAIDKDNNLAGFSNYCKQVKEFCLVAPGVDIIGASNLGDAFYSKASGTSQAAPHVSGAGAVLRGAWPHLTAAQVAKILLNSATDLGEPGVDDVYGHGLLNLEVAVQAQGKNNIAASGYVNSSGYDVRTSKLMTSTIFGDAYQKNISPFLKKAVFFDDFGRDYNANLDQKILSPNFNYYNLDNFLFNHYSFNQLSLYPDKNSSLKIGLVSNFLDNNFAADLNNRVDYLGLRYRTKDNSKEDKSTNNLNNLLFSYHNNLNDYLKIGLLFNAKASDLDEDNPVNRFSFISNVSFLPYHFSQDNNWLDNNRAGSQFISNRHFLVTNNLSKNLSLNFAYSSYGQINNLNIANFSNSNSKIFDGRFNYKISDDLKLGFGYGILQEAGGNLLNSKTQGAFSGGSDPHTGYFRINGSKKIVNGLYFLASYSEGKTELAGNDLGVFRNFSDIKSRAFSFGLLADNFFGAKFGFIYSEPLRVYQGRVNIDIPLARNLEGDITRLAVDNLSLKPSGKEQDLEIFYQKLLKNQANISFNFLVRKEPGNIKNLDTEYLCFGKYVLRF